jgi:hypothetical protein
MPETNKTTFELINELIIAISQLCWPILVFIFIMIFRRELSDILKRIKKGKFLGQELELENEIEIDEFKTVTNEAAQNNNSVEANQSNDEIEIILSKAADDPKIGIILLAMEIEKKILSLISSVGLIRDFQFGSINKSFNILAEHNIIDKALFDSVRIFWDLRNKIIHGRHIEEEGQIIRILDIGVSLLKTLKSIEYEKHIVYKTDIPLFYDSQCTNQRPDVWGLMLQNISTTGKTYNQIFPTQRFNYYKEGEELTWEWNDKVQWGETWYIHPEVKNKISAWISAVEFIGRPLKEI